jgi:hypothetical protein
MKKCTATEYLQKIVLRDVEDKKLIEFTEKWPLNCTFFDSLRW